MKQSIKKRLKQIGVLLLTLCLVSGLCVVPGKKAKAAGETYKITYSLNNATMPNTNPTTITSGNDLVAKFSSFLTQTGEITDVDIRITILKLTATSMSQSQYQTGNIANPVLSTMEIKKSEWWNDTTKTLTIPGSYIDGNVSIAVNYKPDAAVIISAITGTNKVIESSIYRNILSTSASTIDIASNENYTTKLTALNGYTIKYLTVAGENTPLTIDTDYTFDSSTGDLAIKTSQLPHEIYQIIATAFPNSLNAPVTNTLTNITSSSTASTLNLDLNATSFLNSESSIPYAATYTTTLTANSGYLLPNDITVEFAGTALTKGSTTNGYDYNSTTGDLTVYINYDADLTTTMFSTPFPYGLEITASAAEVEYQLNVDLLDDSKVATHKGNTSLADLEGLKAIMDPFITGKGYSESNTKYYGAKLQKKDNTGAWVDVTTVPAGGVVAFLVYPLEASSNPSAYDYLVSHLDVSSATGSMEELTIISKGSGGMYVKVTCLSPIAISWKPIPTGGTGGNGGGSTTTTPADIPKDDVPKTGDDSFNNSSSMGAIFLAGGILFLLSGAAYTVFAARRKED